MKYLNNIREFLVLFHLKACQRVMQMRSIVEKNYDNKFEI